MNKSRNKNQISGTCQKYQSCHSFFSFPAILKKIKKLTISNKIYLILLSGFFFAISFPTTWCGFKLPNFGWLVWVALIPLLIAIEKDNFKKIFQKTFLFASVFTFITLSWILTVLYKNAGYPLWTSFLCLVFIVFVIGLYIGIGFVGAKYISNKTGVPSYITIPIAWVIAEYITNFWPLGGFPWTNLGYSQQYNLYLIQSADIFGILGISFLIILVNALLYEVIGSFKNANYRHVYIHVTAVVIIILCNITYGAIRIALIERNHADTKSSLKVVAIPGNISQDQKWDPRFSQSIINRYRDETYKTASLEPDLIIWPETALSYYLNRHSDVIPSSIVPRLSIPILFGSMMIDPKDKTKQWNSAILSDQGREVSRYDKNHLVPLAEYIPFEFPFIKQAFAANIETQHGKELIPFQIKEHLFGVQICFEDVFPALTRKWLQKGVSFIINLSNMGWYANSSGVFQHRAYSIFRAIENRIFFIKVTNQGTSLVVNPAGIPIQELEQTKDKTWIDVSFSPKKYFSLYRLWGDFPIWILILLFSIGIFVSRFKEGVKMKLLFKPFQIYLKKIGILSIALTIVLFAKASLADSSSEYTAMDYYSNGEAVDLADGGITLQYTDLILSGKGGMDLKVSRSYRSPRAEEQAQVVIDKAIFTGYRNPTGFDEYYDSGEFINTNKVCKSLMAPNEQEGGGFWEELGVGRNYPNWHQYLTYGDDNNNNAAKTTCDIENGAYVEQFRYQEISAIDKPLEVLKKSPTSSEDSKEDFLGGPKDETYEADLHSLGKIKSNGDNLVWLPPENSWIFSGSDYVGAIVFRNVMPFSYEGQIITFLIKSDGSYEAFDERGKRVGYAGDQHRLLEYFSQGVRVDNPIPKSGSISPYGRMPEPKIFNQSLSVKLDSLVLNTLDGKKYTFNKNGKLILYSQMMARDFKQYTCPTGDYCECEGSIRCLHDSKLQCSNCSQFVQNGVVLKKRQLNNIPHWEITTYMLSQETDAMGHSISLDYLDIYDPNFHQPRKEISITDTLGRKIQIIFGLDNTIFLKAPGSTEWRYYQDDEGLIYRVIDPEGRETLFRYSQNSSSLPIIRNWSEFPGKPDVFTEVRYPTGGILRYEAIFGRGGVAHSDVLVTEFPDDRDSNTFYQKYITVDRNENIGITTNLYEKDGSHYRYIYKYSDDRPTHVSLLTKRILNPDLEESGLVVDSYVWKIIQGTGEVYGLLESTTTEKGSAFGTHYTYDDEGRVSDYTDELGQTIFYEYESHEGIDDPIEEETFSQLVHKIKRSKTKAEGSSDEILMTFDRNPLDTCAVIKPSRRLISKISVSVNGGEEEIIKEYCYDADGNIVRETNLSEPNTTYEYDEGTYLSKIIKSADSDSPQPSILTYDKNIGKVLSVTSPDGLTINYEYNKTGQLTKVNYPNESNISYQYLVRYNEGQTNSHNQIIKDIYDIVRDQRKTTIRSFDGFDRLVKIQKGADERSYIYGQNRRVASIIFPGNNRYLFGYDTLKRIVSVVFPGGNEIRYGYIPTTLNGKFAHKLDVYFNNDLYSTLYRDASAKIIRQVRYPGKGQDPVNTDYKYDEFENIIQITSPEGLVTKNIYDHHMRLISRIYPNGDRVDINNISDKSGLLDSFVIQDTKGPITVRVAYDGNNHVTNIDYPDLFGDNLNDYQIEYSDNRVSAIVDAHGRTEFKYTPDGALNEIKQDIPETELDDSIYYGTDGFGKSHWLGYPDGTKVFYITDSQGRVSEMRMRAKDGRLIASIEYAASGDLSVIHFGNGVSNQYQYDLSGNVSDIKIEKGGKLVNQITSSYDKWGNKTKVTYLDGSRVLYDYDGLRRIIKASYFKPEQNTPFSIQNYAYDKDGNRLTYSDAYKSVQYRYSQGMLEYIQLGAGVEKNLTYDIRGNLISEVETKESTEQFKRIFKYDYQDRLIETNVTDKSGSDLKLEYKYDYASRRTTKIVNGKPERYYIYGKSTDPLMELNGEGEIERLFIYLGGRRIAAFGNEEFQYYHLDEIGSVLHTTNDQGNINETVRYDPFGNINFRVGLSSERYLFASKEYDSETGLIYFGARFYDPETGRFITRDPMEQGINHYIFAGNNPLLIEEYFGLGDVIKDIGRVVVGAVVGVVTGVVTGNPITGIYAGIATTAAIFGQRFATGDDNAFMVNMSYSYGGADVPHGETSGRLGDRIHISVGPRTTSPDGRGSQESSTSYHNGCTNRLCFAIQGDGAFVSFDGGNTYVNSGSNSGGGGFGGGFSDNLGGSMGGGSGYSGSGLEISVHYGDEIINTDPLNSPNTFPSNNDAYGDDGASNMSPSGTMPNVGLPAPSSGTGSMPVVQNPDPFNFPQEDDSFIGYGEPPPVPEIVYVPLGFDQQDDTPLPSVQADMSEISANNTVADPVMLYSGDLLQVETDLKIPGRSIDYEFKRTYRSRLDYDGPLGFGWDHNYNKRLVVLKKKDGTGEKGIRRFDGNARYDDYLLEEGVYKAPAGSFDRLIKKANGTYQIRHNNGLIYDYDADGSISSMMDRNGNELTFLYTIIGEEKVLDAVIDTVGRRINYDYNGQGLLTRIVDYTGRTVRFVYDDNVNLTAVHSPAVDEFPVGKVTQYTYSDDHNLLTAINPAGQVYLENEYTTTDRVSRQYLGKDAFDFSYYRRREFYQCEPDSDPALEVSRTTVLDRNGNTTELTFNCQGNPLKVTEFTRGIRPSDPDRFTTTYTYNLNGLVTSVTQPEGNRIDYVYDARSTGDKTIDQLFAENRIQITQISDEDRSGGTSLQSNFTYEPVYNQVLTKTDPDSNTITYYYDYQEGSDFAALAARMNMPESTVRTLLRDVPMARGDLNGDSNTAQLRGNLVRVDQPPLTTEDDTILSYRFRYNGFGQRTSKIKPDGTQDEYSYADNGYLSQIAQDTAGLNITNQYEYDAVGNLIVFVDGNRNRIEFRVNALNQVSRERLPIGAVRNILYDANNNVIQVDEPNLDNEGRAINDNPYITARYEYNILNRPIARIQEVSEGSTILTEYQYDANENLTRVVEPKGNSIAIVYDERDLPYKITKGYASADASTTIINYDGNKDKTQVRDGNGNQTNYIYDGFDRLIQIQDPRGNITRYTYNVLNKSTRIEKQGKTDSRSEESILLQDIRLFYDELGRLISKQEAILNAGEISGNHNLSYQYDVNNRLVRFVDGLGHATHMIYDGLDRLISKTDAKGNRLEYTYDANNNITRQTSLEINDVNASTTAFATSVAYDAINRPITITDNLGHTNQYRYDSRGNLIYSSDPRDLSGLDEGVNAAEGNKKRYAYDGLNRLTQMIQEITDNGAGSGSRIAEIITQYNWDSNSRLGSITDANNHSTHFLYDALNRRIQTTLANGVIYKTSYDANSNAIQTQDPSGFVKDMVYDELNHVTNKVVAQAGVHKAREEYDYNGLDQMVSAASYDAADLPVSILSRRYDSLGNLLNETQNGLTVSSAYDAENNRTRITYPSGKVINLNHDEINRITQISDSSTVLANLDCANQDQIARRSYANGSIVTSHYDGLKRTISHINNHEATVIAGFELGYDKVGNRLYDRFTHKIDSGDVYSYDSLARITQATYGVADPRNHIADPMSGTYERHELYNLDPVYNWISRLQRLNPADPTEDIATSFTANSVNAYESATSTQDGLEIASVAYTYDANGNLSQDDQFTYQYDYRNLLVEVRNRETSEPIVSYKYDVLGRRISKTTLEGEIRFIYDGAHVIEERSDDSVIATYIYGNGIDDRITMERGGHRYFYHTDPSGNVAAITDNTGALVERYEYSAYGEVTITDASGAVLVESGIDNPYLYSGRKYDSETGLYDYRLRTYNPKLGRFIQQDPLGYIDSLNQYAYVLNNPVNFIDPFGLSTMAGSGNVAAGDPSSWLGETWDYVSEYVASNIEESNHKWERMMELQAQSFSSLSSEEQAELTNLAYDMYGGLLGGGGIKWLGGGGKVGAGFAGKLFDKIGDATWRRWMGNSIYLERGGYAVQSNTSEAIQALYGARSGWAIYRQGTFRIQNISNAQFWSFENPTTVSDFANRMGMPGFSQPRIDWMIGGRLKPQIPAITRPAPGIGSNIGEGMELVVPQGGVQIDWFYMP